MNEDYLRVKALELALDTHSTASTAALLSIAETYYQFLSGNTEKEKK